MISETPRQHQASYDDEGNIIIPPSYAPTGASECKPEGGAEPQPEPEPEPKDVPVNEPPKQEQKHVLNNMRREFESLLKQAGLKVTDLSEEFLEEGSRQYAWSMQSGREFFRHASGNLRERAVDLWAFLTQPVLVPRRNKKPKQHSRGTLFLLDVVRFGGTFAFIFVALFVSMNYQSFWQIAKSNFDPLDQAASSNAAAAVIDATLKDKLLNSPMLATAGRPEGDLLSYLPEVGPPENRLIIPKLGMNVPLVTPSYQALLKEDWETLETDIQDALSMGAVHYPGTARPGQAGNFFVTGHSSYYPWAPGKYKTVFARLTQLQPGDEYWVYYGGDKHRYIIRKRKEVSPNDVSVLDQPLGKRVGTLMTCTPVGTTLRRLILSAEEVDPSTGIVMEVGEHPERELPEAMPVALPI